MVDFTQFEEDLKEALQKLRSPGYLPPDSVCQVVDCRREEGPAAALVRILQAIQEMEPDPGLQSDSQPRRIHTFLHLRYAQGINQEEIAEQLHMSVRNLQRIQPEAVHMLALHLWQKFSRQEHAAQTPGLALDWAAQVEKELSSLATGQPETTAGVQQVIDSLRELRERLFSIYGVEIQTGFIQPGVTAAVHPSILRQVFISMLARLSRIITGGKIEIFGGLEDGEVKISMTGQAGPQLVLNTAELTGGIPIPQGARIQVRQNEDHLFVQIWLPASGQHVVLVVEDNADVVHYYRRCTAGTSFQIVHAASAAQVMDLIRSTTPEIIVLDVMMPDIDGWQMLTHLHETPETRAIPVIVCSIISEPELSLALGAVGCLTKPVKFQQFVDALNQALTHAQPPGSPPVAGSSAAA